MMSRSEEKSLKRICHMTGPTVYETADHLRFAHATPVNEEVR